MNLLSVAARNVLRNKVRTTLTLSGAAIAVLAFVMIRTILSAWEVAAEYAAKDRLVSRHKVSFVMQLPKRYIDTVREVPGVKQASFATWFGAKDPRNPNEFFASFAVDQQTYFDVLDECIIKPEAKQKFLEDRKAVIVGDVLANKIGVKPGDRITLQGTIYPGDWEFNVVGIYEAARKSVDRSQFIFRWDYLNESIPERRREQIGWIVARVDDPSKGAEISQTIDKIFDEKDTQTATMSERAMNLSFIAGASAMLTALDVVSIIIMVIMMMILGNTIAMGVRERTQEYGVLRALGFTPRHIISFIVGEGFTTGILAGALGIAISYPIVQMGLGRFLEENVGAFFPYFRIEPKVTAMAILLSVALATLASLIPAYRASRLSVTDALRRIA